MRRGFLDDYAEEYVLSRIKEVVFNDNILKDIVNNLSRERKEGESSDNVASPSFSIFTIKL